MNSFAALADPVRRTIVELLGDGERTAGELAELVGPRFTISQPAVSNQLRVLREAGIVTVRADGARRYYRIDEHAFDDVVNWFHRHAPFWAQRLDALETELVRHRRASPSHARPTTEVKTRTERTS